MENITELIIEIENYSGNRLKRKEDLSTLIELAYSGNKNDLIEELSFTAKYVQGLFRILKQAADNADIQNTAQIKTDLSDNLEKVKNKIEELLLKADETTRVYFRETYLELSQNSLFSLTELMNDLEWTKKYLNQAKRTNPN